MKNLLYLIIVFSCTVSKINSQTLSWSGFPAGGTSYTTGIMTATITSASAGFQNGAPKYYAGNTVGNGQCGISGGLALEHLFGNITNAHSTLTMDYTSGNTTNGLCGNISFQVKDINADESVKTFADWVEVSAIDGNNNPIPVANITATGGTNKVITVSGNTRIVKGYSSGGFGSRNSTLCDDVTFTVTPPAGTTLKSVTLKYHPDYTPGSDEYFNFYGPKRPAYQYISISPIIANATAGPTSVVLNTTEAGCNQDNGTVTIGAVTGGSSPYQFNFNNLGLSTTTNFSNLAGGSYPVIVKDNNGCTYSTNALINVATGPTAIVTNPTNAGCTQNNGTVSFGAVTGGVAPYQYNFNNTGLSTTTSFSNLAAGSYPLVVEDVNGCTYNTTVTVGTSTGPTAIIVNPTSATCGQANGTVTFGTVTGGVAPYQYNFNNTGLSATTNFSNLAAGSYPLVVQDASGCTYSTNVVVSAASGPTGIGSTVTNTGCGQNNGTVILGVVTGGTSPYSYSFDSQPFSATTTYQNLEAGNYSLVVQDASGCTFTTSVSISNSAGPTAIAFTVADEHCGASNGSVVLGTVTGGNAPYQYNFNATGFSSATSYNNLVSGTFSLAVQDNTGCVFNTTVTINNLQDGPTAIVSTVTGTSCTSNTGSVSLGAVTGGTAPFQYNFNNAGLSASTLYPNLGAGLYNLIVQDHNGCVFTTQITVQSLNGPTAINVTSTDDFCGQNAGTTTFGTVTGGTAPYQYNFNNLGYSNTVFHQDLQGNVYNLIVRDANGCTYSTTITIGSTPGISDIATSVTNAKCNLGNGQVILGAVTGGTTPYQYNFNGLGFSSNQNYSNLAGGIYALVVKDANGCVLNTTVNIGSPSAPNNFDIHSTIPYCGMDAGVIEILSVNGGIAPYTYSINGGTAVSSTLFSNLAANVYTLQLTDANGCSLTKTVDLIGQTALESLRIPNVFTPDGDQVNETWFIAGNCISELKCVILNRWGDVMETFDDITDEWDGTFNSKKVLAGTYFYKANVTFMSGEQKEYHGHITVVY